MPRQYYTLYYKGSKRCVVKESVFFFRGTELCIRRCAGRKDAHQCHKPVQINKIIKENAAQK